VAQTISRTETAKDEINLTMHLGELCQFIIDCEHKTAPTQETGYPSIRTPNIGRGHFNLENVNRVSEETYRLWTKRAVPQPGDLIMAREAPVGNVARIPEGLQPCLGQRTLLIRPDNSKVDSTYLTYLLIGEEVQGIIHAMTNGATVAHLNMNDVRVLPLPKIPPLQQQKRIAGILLAYDELIENHQRRMRILEEMARAFYREWFVHFRFPGHESHKRVASPLGRVPQGWEGVFGDIASIERSGVNPSEFADEQFEHFSIPAFDNGREPAIEFGRTILSGKYGIDGSCVLLSKLNPRIPRVWLPQPSGSCRAITSTEFLVLQPRPGITREFIYSKCCSEQFAGQFGSLAIGTSTSHQRVKPDNLLTLPSTVPDRSTIERFSLFVAPIMAMSQTNRGTIHNLKRTRDLFLPRLLSGQVNVGTN
jgi:type I restriction enzyme, S subunit